MRTLATIATIAVLPAVLVTACDDEGPETETYVATLSGGAEVPPVTTTATGTATLTLTGSSLNFTIEVSDIDSANAAHIHAGAAGANGGVMVGLFDGPTTALDFTGTLMEGTVTVVDSVITRLQNGTAYVNVHTVANAPGEIRGQVQQQ